MIRIKIVIREYTFEILILLQRDFISYRCAYIYHNNCTIIVTFKVYDNKSAKLYVKGKR